MFITGFYVIDFLYLIFKFPLLSPLCALGVNPTSFTMDTGCFPGVEQPELGVEVKERLGLYFYAPSGPSWPVLG
jgi:hypothetical protein